LFEYAVVAEERARRLAIIDPAGPCLSDGDGCELPPILTVELPERPHNLTGVGSVVYATHPAAGSISRVDIATGDILTAAVGSEPHDIKYAPMAGALYVADESGRRLLVVDSETLDVIDAVNLPAQPHDLAVAEDAIWVTLIGRNELARVSGDEVELFPTGGSPHDLIVDPNGLIWFSSWGSRVLHIFDPATGTTAEAPAGVTEPHHFAIAPDGTVWLSDNGGAAIVGFVAQPVTVDVGPTPHHLGFVGDTIVVAVSGTGEAVLIRDGQVVASSQLTTGLHGVAAVELTQPPNITKR
jgi:streptogramin lyase